VFLLRPNPVALIPQFAVPGVASQVSDQPQSKLMTRGLRILVAGELLKNKGNLANPTPGQAESR